MDLSILAQHPSDRGAGSRHRAHPTLRAFVHHHPPFPYRMGWVSGPGLSRKFLEHITEDPAPIIRNQLTQAQECISKYDAPNSAGSLQGFESPPPGKERGHSVQGWPKRHASILPTPPGTARGARSHEAPSKGLGPPSPGIKRIPSSSTTPSAGARPTARGASPPRSVPVPAPASISRSLSIGQEISSAGPGKERITPRKRDLGEVKPEIPGDANEDTIRGPLRYLKQAKNSAKTRARRPSASRWAATPRICLPYGSFTASRQTKVLPESRLRGD